MDVRERHYLLKCIYLLIVLDWWKCLEISIVYMVSSYAHRFLKSVS